MKTSDKSVLVVFDPRNYARAIYHCKRTGREWVVLCAYQIGDMCTHNDPLIKTVWLFDQYPYDRSVGSARSRSIILDFFAHMRLGDIPLVDALRVEGVPLLKVKDNDLLIYLFHRLVFTIDATFRFLQSYDATAVFIVANRADRFSIPEWPNVDWWIDWDIFYGPIFAHAAAHNGIAVECAAICSFFRGHLRHFGRELVLAATRVSILLLRGLTWRDCRGQLRGPKSVAIWARAKAQVLEIEPLIRHWIERGPITPFIFQDDSLKKSDCLAYLQANSALPFVAAHHYFTVGRFIRAIACYLGYRLFGLRRLSMTSYEEDVHDDPIRAAFAEPAICRALAASLAEAVLSGALNAMEMARCHADVGFSLMIVLNTNDQWGAIAGYLGKARGFQTVSLQNFPFQPYAFPTPLSAYDVHIASDLIDRERIVAAGCPPEKIRTLGSILYSELSDRSALETRRQRSRVALGFNSRERAVLVGTQSFSMNSSHLNTNILDLLFDIVRQNREIRGLVKVHPYEKIEHYWDWIETAKHEGLPIEFFGTDSDIRDLIAASDVYVSRYSTTLFLAAIMGKPSISLLTKAEEIEVCETMAFLASHVISVFHDLASARDAVLTALDPQWAPEVVREQHRRLEAVYGHYYDGGGAERIRQFIEQLAMKEAVGQS